jgi:hypothetical protein
MECQSKVSYKSVVCENPIVASSTGGKELQFTAWEDLPFHDQPQLLKLQPTVSAQSNGKQSRREATYKKELLLDMLNEIAYLTDYVKEYYGCKGIGDELKLDEVLNAFESSICVDVHSETDFDFGFSEEDE